MPLIALPLALAIGAPTVRAQAASAQSLTDQLRSCAAEPDSARRLACYDRLAFGLPSGAGKQTAARPKSVAAGPSAPANPTAPAVPTAPAGATASASPTAPASPASPAVSPPAAKAAAPAAITSAATEASEFGVGNGPLLVKQQKGKPKSMTAVVASVASRGRGELVMTLDNGQVWVQNQAGGYFPVKAGDKVEIDVGALNSYLMWLPSARRASKVTREQ